MMSETEESFIHAHKVEIFGSSIALLGIVIAVAGRQRSHENKSSNDEATQLPPSEANDNS